MKWKTRFYCVFSSKKFIYKSFFTFEFWQSANYWHFKHCKIYTIWTIAKPVSFYSNKSDSQSRFVVDRQTRKHVQRERDYRKTSWSRSKYDAPPVEGTRVPQEEGVTLRSREIAGATRISRSTIDRVFDNSNRRRYGMGIVGRFFGYISYFIPILRSLK